MGIFQTFMCFLQNSIFQEIQFFKNRCILMHCCYHYLHTYHTYFVKLFHQCIKIIAPVGEVCKHASAHQHVQTMAKYHVSVASSLFAYISYKVFEFLKHSFIKCNTMKICKHRFSLQKICKIKHHSKSVCKMNM